MSMSFWINILNVWEYIYLSSFISNVWIVTVTSYGNKWGIEYEQIGWDSKNLDLMLIFLNFCMFLLLLLFYYYVASHFRPVIHARQSELFVSSDREQRLSFFVH